MEPNGKNGNGNWAHWVNTVLILIVAGLMSMYISATERRIARLEDEMMRISLIQATSGAKMEMIEQELTRLRPVR